MAAGKVMRSCWNWVLAHHTNNHALVYLTLPTRHPWVGFGFILVSLDFATSDKDASISPKGSVCPWDRGMWNGIIFPPLTPSTQNGLSCTMASVGHCLIPFPEENQWRDCYIAGQRDNARLWQAAKVPCMLPLCVCGSVRLCVPPELAEKSCCSCPLSLCRAIWSHTHRLLLSPSSFASDMWWNGPG